ncbi:Gfo/Idh/MocA family oxidoreductase [Neolewinella aurantiaca]|uniref:Gfo/Idh/MocA family oxidoreductase n=1 Tax=Neolewinella aurantiaca TaxID=2602767 RepID=A0A5C7FDN0_9BACT|nr:Gfo/Idh/MocA family oxidoreductase [Neolewinella aurantiaca]TXF88787.1 Gfo/Idh/MocA family oxidoreductase [Neolewinella aurantiaca]
MLKIGLLGTGHLGKIHLKCIRLAKARYDLIGFYDADPDTARHVAEEFHLKAYDSPEALIAASEVVDVVTPTPTHHAMVKLALEGGCHVFVEKPLTRTLEEAKELIELSRKTGKIVQVGHVERFNPALLALGDLKVKPYFIEAHRLAMFNPRGVDVSVVLDLMIHDLDIILKLADDEVTDVRASGVAVVSDTPDIVNARIEFKGGAVANLTASRISLKNMRKVRLFQPDAYISLDLLEKKSEIVRLFEMDAQLPEDGQQFPLETPKGPRIIHVDQPDSGPVNAIQLELESLADSITQGKPAAVSIEDGYRALDLAHRITEAVEANQQRLPDAEV